MKTDRKTSEVCGSTMSKKAAYQILTQVYPVVDAGVVNACSLCSLYGNTNKKYTWERYAKYGSKLSTGWSYGGYLIYLKGF